MYRFENCGFSLRVLADEKIQVFGKLNLEPLKYPEIGQGQAVDLHIGLSLNPFVR